MKTRKGRKSSDLDAIRPTRWTQTDELLRLLAILEHTIEVTPTAATLLDEILANPLTLIVHENGLGVGWFLLGSLGGVLGAGGVFGRGVGVRWGVVSGLWLVWGRV